MDIFIWQWGKMRNSSSRAVYLFAQISPNCFLAYNNANILTIFDENSFEWNDTEVVSEEDNKQRGLLKIAGKVICE